MRTLSPFPHLARRLLGDRAGHFAIMTAVLAPVALTLTAFAVDVGANYVAKRRAQAITDLAAMAAASRIDQAVRAARLAFEDNGIDDIRIVEPRPDGSPDPDDSEVPQSGSSDGLLLVVPGSYAADPALPASVRFEPMAEPHNAVRVSYRGTGKRYFAGAFMPPPRYATTATASASAEAGFSIGSRLAALDGGIANALLGELLGTTVGLSLMDYEALADADIELFGFLDSLATQADLTAASYGEVLDAEITMGQMAEAARQTPDLGASARSALSDLRAATGGPGAQGFRLSHLIDLGGQRGNVLDAEIERVGADVGLLDLVMASAAIAGRGRQVDLDLGAGVPGLLAVTVDLAIGEPPQHAPWFRVGSEGGVVRTAQTRLGLTARIGGPGGVLGSSINLPLYLELAFAEARLKDVSCMSAGRAARVDVEARPGVADLHIGEVDRARLHDFSSPAPVRPARLIDMPLVSVGARAHAEIANGGYETLSFSAADIEAGRIRQVSTHGLTTSLTQSLLSDLRLDIDVVGLGLGLPSGLTSTLGRTLGAATPGLDRVLDSLLAMLGLSVGQADIRVHNAECRRSVLVQ